MGQAFSNPTVRINDVTFSIVPNTVRSIGGDGETNVRAASAGGNSIETIHTSNAETKIGQIMFDVYPTANIEQQLRTLKNNIGLNTVSLVESFSDGTSASETLTGASLTNAPEKAKSADGTIPLEWSGNPTELG